MVEPNKSRAAPATSESRCDAPDLAASRVVASLRASTTLIRANSSTRAASSSRTRPLVPRIWTERSLEMLLRCEYTIKEVKGPLVECVRDLRRIPSASDYQRWSEERRRTSGVPVRVPSHTAIRRSLRDGKKPDDSIEVTISTLSQLYRATNQASRASRRLGHRRSC